MPILFDNTSQLTGPSPWVLANVEVSSAPKLIAAYGLTDGDLICFRRVVSSSSPKSGYSKQGCTITAPESGAVLARADVISCGVKVCLCEKQPTVVLTEPGDYELIGSGDGITSGSVYIEAEDWMLDTQPPAPCFDCTAPPVEECDPDAWTETGVFECRGETRFNEEINDCGTKRMVDAGPVTWTPTGRTQCTNGIVEEEVTNECGASKWEVTATECGFCPSYALPVDRCDGGTGFAFRESDHKDPAATVEIADCDGDFKVFVFPTAARGHTIPVTDCDGTVLGFATNASDCAGQTVQTVTIDGALEIAKLPRLQVDKLPKLEVQSLPDLKVASLPAVEIGKVAPLTVSELPEIKVAKHVVAAVQAGNEVWTIWSDGTKTVEELPPLPVPPVVYCPSIRLFGDGTPGFGYHEADPKDPAATVEITACDGSLDPVYIYPTAGQGHTLRMTDCAGNLLGYAANQSACAAEFHPETVINVTPVFKPTVNVAAPAVNVAAPSIYVAAPDVIVEPAEVTYIAPPSPLVGASFSQEGELTLTNADGTALNAQIPTC